MSLARSFAEQERTELRASELDLLNQPTPEVEYADSDLDDQPSVATSARTQPPPAEPIESEPEPSQPEPSQSEVQRHPDYPDRDIHGRMLPKDLRAKPAADDEQPQAEEPQPVEGEQPQAEAPQPVARDENLAQEAIEYGINPAWFQDDSALRAAVDDAWRADVQSFMRQRQQQYQQQPQYQQPVAAQQPQYQQPVAQPQQTTAEAAYKQALAKLRGDDSPFDADIVNALEQVFDAAMGEVRGQYDRQFSQVNSQLEAYQRQQTEREQQQFVNEMASGIRALPEEWRGTFGDGDFSKNRPGTPEYNNLVELANAIEFEENRYRARNQTPPPTAELVRRATRFFPHPSNGNGHSSNGKKPGQTGIPRPGTRGARPLTPGREAAIQYAREKNRELGLDRMGDDLLLADSAI